MKQVVADRQERRKGRMASGRKKQVISGLALAVACALTMPQAFAMTYHVNGDQIVASGQVDSGDTERLRDMLARARAAGKNITTVVFRNSPGGVAVEGTGVGNLIREMGLNTVFQGGCYSACTAAFAGGVERGMAEFNLPSINANYGQNIFGIHGASLLGTPVSSEQQQPYIDHMLNLMGIDLTPEAIARIRQAHLELRDSQGFLRYYDPASGTVTTFCPGQDRSENGGCTAYSEATITGDGIVNREGYAPAPNDILRIDASVSGDLNPHFGLDSLEDAYGLIVLENGGRWDLSTTSPASILWANGGELILHGGAEGYQTKVVETPELDLGILVIPGSTTFELTRTTDWLYASNGGMIRLAGGNLHAGSLYVIDQGGTLAGSGSISGLGRLNAGSVFAPQGVHLKPYLVADLESGAQVRYRMLSLGDVLSGMSPITIMNLNADSTTLFNVSAETTAPLLYLDQARVASGFTFLGTTWTQAQEGARLLISPLANLAINAERDFYRRGQEIPLVGIYRDETDPDPEGRVLPDRDGEAMVSSVAEISGRFGTAMRTGDDGYRVDLTQQDAVFRPAHNALLSFTVHQTSEAIWLEANPAFDDTWLFANAQSGDGLGVALRDASEKETSALQPVLGALQFADRDVARAQAGALRGDGHASLRMADLALVGSFGGVVGQHLSSLRNRGEDGGGMAAMGVYSSGAGTMAGSGGFQLSQLMMHLNDPGTSEGAVPADGGVRFWARGFGQVGRLDAEGQVARMNYNIGGVLLGVDKALADGKVVLGGNLGFGSLSATTRGTQFRGEVDAIDIGAYLDADYGRGFVNLSARYTDLSHDTTRSIVGIEGLEDPHPADYGNSALSARLEHGFSLRTAGGTVWQPLLPVIDYVRLDDVDFTESGVASLAGSNGDIESIRAGAGLQVWKSFRSKGGDVLTPHARVLWQKELGDTQARFMSAFTAEPGLVFGAASQDIGDTALSWNLGINSRATDKLSILLDYLGQRTDGSTSHGFILGLGYRF